MKTNIHFWSHLAQFFLDWENVSDKSCRENQNTLFVFSNFLLQNEIMWKNFVESSWNVMAQGDAREGKWRGNWQMEWVASITTTDAHTSAASSRLNWRPLRFKCIRPFRRKTKSGFCVCAITFQTQSRTWQATDENSVHVLCMLDT